MLCAAAGSPPAALPGNPRSEPGLALWGSRAEDNQGALVAAFGRQIRDSGHLRLQPCNDSMCVGDTRWDSQKAQPASQPTTAQAGPAWCARAKRRVRGSRRPDAENSGAAPRGRTRRLGGSCGRLAWLRWGGPGPRQEVKAISGRRPGQMGRPCRSRARRAFTQSERSPFGRAAGRPAPTAPPGCH